MPPFHRESELRSVSSSEAVPNVPNVLVVGETGVGKSSLINLVAGNQLAEVYSVPGTGTPKATSYDIILQEHQKRGHHIRLFDTVGLNEPHFEKRDYLSAIDKTNGLICQLQRTDGIHLLLFCIRAGRITATTQNNFRLFSDILCQNKVPVALVVTGLENEEHMEDWWTKNESFLKAYGLTCTLHACVTAIRGRDDRYMEEYHQSQTAIRAMLLTHMTGAFTPWLLQPQRVEGSAHLIGRMLRWLRGGEGLEKELARQLQDKCKFTRSDAKYLATKIWAERLKNSSSG